MLDILQKNTVINDKNKDLIIETLRQMAEVMIWGDQHNANFFEYAAPSLISFLLPIRTDVNPSHHSFFLENNILGFFLKILSQKTSQKVKIQLLQTLSILVTGLKSETSLCEFSLLIYFFFWLILKS